jgi:hypothetical protein
VIKLQKINCYDKNGTTLNHLVQWDKNQVIYADNLINDAVPKIHFAHSKHLDVSKLYKDTVSVSDGKLAITIPNDMIVESGKLFVYLYYTSTVSSDPGTTEYVIELIIKAKPEPDEYIYEDNVEWLSISQLEKIIDSLAKRVSALEEKIT